MNSYKLIPEYAEVLLSEYKTYERLLTSLNFGNKEQLEHVIKNSTEMSTIKSLLYLKDPALYHCCFEEKPTVNQLQNAILLIWNHIDTVERQEKRKKELAN